MKKRILFLGIYFTFLSACQNAPLNIENECIAPPIAFSQSNPEELNTRKELPPPTPWYSVAEFPETPNGAIGQYNIALIRSHNSYDEIWINWCWIFATSSEPNECGYIVFRTDTNSWKVIVQQKEEKQTDRLPDKLFLAKTGDVWGIRDFSFGEDYSILARFNQNKQVFESIRDPDNILNEDNLPSVVSFAMDEYGILWMIYGKSLFNFTPTTLKANRFTILEDQQSQLSHLTIMLDGTIYLNVDGKKELIRFSSKSGDIIDRISVELPINQVPPIYGANPAGDSFQINESFLDNQGRLWIHNYGWMTPDGSWYTLLSRFPGFFGIWQEELGYYGWLIPKIITESSDGSLWFSSANGISRFNPDKGDWCWITSEQSNIVEDQQHNLWMIADGKLYKYPLNP